MEFGSVRVLARGVFQEGSRTDERTIFVAPYGDPVDPGHGPRVSVICDNSGLRRKVPEGRFFAWCLGEIDQPWNYEDGVLVIDPIAIFK